MSLSNYPNGCTSADLHGFNSYASETDGVEELCESQGFDWELLSEAARETLAIKLMSSEDWAIDYLNRIKEELCD